MDKNSHSQSTQPQPEAEPESETETGSETKVQMGKQGDSSSKSLHPLEMEHIVEKIFGNLNVTSLKSARQVNKLWSFEGVKILMKNVWMSLPRDFHSSKNQEELKEEFQTFLSYNSFKIPQLCINNPADVPVFKSLKVLKEEAKEVKALKCQWLLTSFAEEEGESVEEEEVVEEQAELLKELLYNLPNLIYVDLEVNIFHQVKRVLMDFCLEQSSSKKKPLILSKFGLRTNTPDLRVFELYEKFAQCQGVRIRQFWVLNSKILYFYPREGNLQKRFIDMINAFLLRDQKSLRELIFVAAQQYLNQLQFPEMPKLETISLNLFREGRNSHLNSSYAFPPSFKFPQVAPNLQQVILSWFSQVGEREMPQDGDGGEDNSDIWTKVFESTGVAPSVKGLIFSEVNGDLKIDKLFHVFPNVQVLFSRRDRHFEFVAPSIWEFGGNLTHLTFEIQLHLQSTQLSRFDSIFTGFSQETVDRIKNAKDVEKDMGFQKVENLRVNPSILNLKGLKDLRIKFSGPCSKYFPRRILTVAADYAFKLMPNVKIKIDVKECTPDPKAALAALKKVSQLPNVEIEVE